MIQSCLKVAYIIGGLPFGGVERCLYDLHMEFARRAERGAAVVQGRIFNLSGTGLLQEKFEQAGLAVEKIGSNKRSLLALRLDTLYKLRKRLKIFAPDIIHTMHFSANYFGRLASLGLNRPVLTHLHNIKREKKIFRRARDLALSYATDAYLAVSNAVADIVQQDHNLAARPVHVLYNGIDPANFTLAPVNLQKECGLAPPVVLSVGRYVPQKNMDKLIQAVDLLRKQQFPVSLALVGEGPERSALEQLVQSLGLEKQVVLTGFREDAPAFYQAGALFAMPSEFEGFLFAQLEAMYCGLPCIVSEHVPAVEIAGESALICAVTPEDIAAKIRFVLENTDLRQHMSEQARNIAAQYTIDKYVDQLLEIYHQCLSAHRQR